MSRVNVVSVLDHGHVFSQAESFPIKLLCAVSLETGVGIPLVLVHHGQSLITFLLGGAYVCVDGGSSGQMYVF